MDGAHDLGGKENFGPIDVNEPDEAFHAEWEGRCWAFCNLTDAPGWTIDWWRHAREAIPPVDYLSRPYFDQWITNNVALMIDSGVLTMEEVVSGQPAGAPAETPPAEDREAVLAACRDKLKTFEEPADAPPAFAVGDRARCRMHGHRGHTRLPAYARGAAGRIIAHHGAHSFPDAGANGVEQAQHLYTVAFAVGDLFPERAGDPDSVRLDLWESYLEQV